MTGAPPRHVVLILHAIMAGGMETYCIDVAREFVARGVRVTAMVSPAPPLDVIAGRFRQAGATVVRTDTTRDVGRWRQAAGWLPLALRLRRLHPDVVHLHLPGAGGGLAFLAAARFGTRATIIVTEHEVPGVGAGARQRIVHHLVDRVAHATLAVSRRNASLRRQRSSARERTFASILNGVPIPDVSAVEQCDHRTRVRRQLDIPEDAIVIGSVVRLAANKGLHDLIRAFAIIAATRPCRLLLVGGGPLLDELQALTRELGVDTSVHFAGEQRDPAPYIDAMDVFALAVPEGSMSIALLEAMARGLPPVITFCGPEEAVIDGETGLAAPPSDPVGLAAVLGRLTDDADLRHQLGAAAALHVRRHFSISRVADDLLSVYAAAPRGYVPAHLRADAPPNPRPGDRPLSDGPSGSAGGARAADTAAAPRTRS